MTAVFLQWRRTLSLSSTSGDALDSNGSVAMTGGILVAQGPNSAPEVAMDYNGSFNNRRIADGFRTLFG